MKYDDIKNIIWFKKGIPEEDKSSIENCINNIKEELVINYNNVKFINNYGALLICEVFHQYYKKNNVVFFINHNLIIDLISMSMINGEKNKKQIEYIFQLNKFDNDIDTNVEKNIENIKKKVKESSLFNLPNIYDFLKNEIKEEDLPSKEDIDNLLNIIKNALEHHLEVLVVSIQQKEHFSKYSLEERKEIIETMVYYSYVNEVIFITNKLRNKFIGNIVVNDFINNSLFPQYVRALLVNSEVDGNGVFMNSILKQAPTGENLTRQHTVVQHNVVKFGELDLNAYNKAAINQLNTKYKKPSFLDKVKGFFSKN